jgi:Hypoxia induced protein conserved region
MIMLTALIILALIATLISLGWGIGSMAHGGSFDARHSSQFMNARVIFQGLTVVLLIIAFFYTA